MERYGSGHSSRGEVADLGLDVDDRLVALLLARHLCTHQSERHVAFCASTRLAEAEYNGVEKEEDGVQGWWRRRGRV